MNAPRPKMPELEPASDSGQRWQFSLAWMFVVMTVVAAIAAMLRYAAGNIVVQIVLSVYLFGGMLYVILGVPRMLMLSREFRRIRENRRKLAAWARWRRDAQDADESVE